jgi:hypothetical protein
MQRTCPNCGKEVVSARGNAVYCSGKCRRRHWTSKEGWVEVAKLRPFIQRLIAAELARKR